MTNVNRLTKLLVIVRLAAIVRLAEIVQLPFTLLLSPPRMQQIRHGSWKCVFRTIGHPR